MPTNLYDQFDKPNPYDAVPSSQQAAPTPAAPAPEWGGGLLNTQPPRGLDPRAIEAMNRMKEGVSGKRLEGLAYKAGEKVSEGLAGHVPAPVAGAAGAATDVAVSSVPSLLGANVGAEAAPAFRWTGKWLMRSALKPSLSLAKGKGERAVQTLLDHKINLTGAGMAKLRASVDALKQEVESAIQRSTESMPFPSIKKSDVAKRLTDVFDKFKDQVLNAKDLRAISRAAKEFEENPYVQRVMTPQQAQQIKEGTYRMLGEKAYGELKTAEREAGKALARGLKEEIEKVVPEVTEPNSRMSELINAGNRAETRMTTAGNRNVGGIGWLYAHPTSFAAFEAERSPAIASWLANTLYSGARGIPAALGGAAGAMGIPFLAKRDQGGGW